MNKLLDKILSEIVLDPKVKNGTFNIEEDDHMEALRNYLTKKDIDEESVRTFSNRVLEGKYPERQAYNVNGILVTFPTPEYKKEAINRGTHFEKDPTKGASNLFSDTPKSSPETSAKEEPEDKSSEPKTNLPVSQTSKTPATGDEAPEPVQAKTTAAPQQTPTISLEPTPDPIVNKEPTDLPPPPIKSPKEKEADKNAIKTMLKGDDYMLENVVDWIIHNGPPHLMEQIKRKL